MKTSLLLIVILFIFPFLPVHAQGLHLQFWHSMTGEKGKLLQEIVHDFNERPENKNNLIIDQQFVGSYEEGLNKLRTALIGGSGPHIVQITDIGTRVMIDSDAVAPLQDFIDNDRSFPMSQILPQIRNYYSVNGRLYSLPFATSNPVLYYNSELFAKAKILSAPKTFAELEADAKKLTQKEMRITGVTWPLHSWIFEQFVARQGALFTKPLNGRSGRATKADFSSPQALKFLRLWERMNRDGTFANVGRGWDPAEQNFLAARTAMLVTSSGDILEITKQAPFAAKTAPIPSDPDDKLGGTIVGGNSLWIMKDKSESEKLAAFKFLKFMASTEVQEKWHTHTGYFPIRQDVIDKLKKDGFYTTNPNVWTAIAQLQSSHDGPATQGALIGVFPEVREHICTAIEEILAQTNSVEKAMSLAEAKSNFSLQRYNRGKK